VIPSEAAFQAYGKVRTAKFLIDAASLDEPNGHMREALEKLAMDLSTMASVCEVVAYALRDSHPQLMC